MKINYNRIRDYVKYVFLVSLIALVVIQLYEIAVLKFEEQDAQSVFRGDINIDNVSVEQEFTGDFYVTFDSSTLAETICSNGCEYSAVIEEDENYRYVAGPVECQEECEIRIVDDLVKEAETFRIEVRNLEEDKVVDLYVSQSLQF